MRFGGISLLLISKCFDVSSGLCLLFSGSSSNFLFSKFLSGGDSGSFFLGCGISIVKRYLVTFVFKSYFKKAEVLFEIVILVFN